MLRLVNRSRGWRWPIEVVEVWKDLDLLAELPEALVQAIVAHYLAGAELSRRIDDAQAPPPRKHLAKAEPPAYDAQRVAAFRARRRSRRPEP